ncbi:MAG TPA: protein kinase [Candidatus Limnocylindrales bacterium]|nr:protein kinase [Candidatus Limnocylindrales bacterium]
MTTLGGRYRPIRRIGSGGMGTVWETEDLVLNRRVAVKILSPSLCDDETIAARFRREAQAAGRLVHPNIAAVFDYGEEQGCPFIVMELVQGTNLREVLDEHTRLTVAEAVGVAAQVADALAAAHAEGIVHRDVKPGNVMLTEDGRVKVMDFGIADASWFEPITDTGMVMATARYISPEQATGSSGGPASDVYSLGIVLYEMLAGRPPFEGTSPFAIAAAHAYEVPPPVTRFAAALPTSVADLVDLATRKDARERPTAEAFAERLRAAEVVEPTATLPLAPSAASEDTVALDPTPDAAAGRPRAAWLWAAAVVLGLLLVVSVLVAATSGARDPVRRDDRRTATMEPRPAAERTSGDTAGAGTAGEGDEGPPADPGSSQGNGNAYGHDNGNGKD